MTIVEKSCRFSKNKFKFDLDGTVAVLDSYEMDPTNIRLFFILVVEITDILKEKGCTCVRMWCVQSDWDNYIKNTDWKIVTKDTKQQNIINSLIPKEIRGEQRVLTEVEIDKFPTAIAKGCGFEPVV